MNMVPSSGQDKLLELHGCSCKLNIHLLKNNGINEIKTIV